MNSEKGVSICAVNRSNVCVSKQESKYLPHSLTTRSQISMPNNTMLNVVGWNQEKGYLAAGGDQGLLKVLKLESGKGQGGGNLSMNQNLQGHQGNVCVLQWND